MDWLVDIPSFVTLAGDGPFKIIIAIAIVYGVKELGMLRRSIGKLHTAIEVIIERTSSHEKRITTLERKRK